MSELTDNDRCTSSCASLVSSRRIISVRSNSSIRPFKNQRKDFRSICLKPRKCYPLPLPKAVPHLPRSFFTNHLFVNKLFITRQNLENKEFLNSRTFKSVVSLQQSVENLLRRSKCSVPEFDYQRNGYKTTRYPHYKKSTSFFDSNTVRDSFDQSKFSKQIKNDSKSFKEATKKIQTLNKNKSQSKNLRDITNHSLNYNCEVHTFTKNYFRESKTPYFSTDKTFVCRTIQSNKHSKPEDLEKKSYCNHSDVKASINKLNLSWNSKSIDKHIGSHCKRKGSNSSECILQSYNYIEGIQDKTTSSSYSSGSSFLTESSSSSSYLLANSSRKICVSLSNIFIKYTKLLQFLKSYVTGKLLLILNLLILKFQSLHKDYLSAIAHHLKECNFHTPANYHINTHSFDQSNLLLSERISQTISMANCQCATSCKDQMTKCRWKFCQYATISESLFLGPTLDEVALTIIDCFRSIGIRLGWVEDKKTVKEKNCLSCSITNHDNDENNECEVVGKGQLDVVKWLHDEYLTLAKDVADANAAVEHNCPCTRENCPIVLQSRRFVLDRLAELLEKKQELEIAYCKTQK